MAHTDGRWPGECDEEYPEVFTVPPKKDHTSKANVLTDEQLKQFFEDGYVMVEDLLTADDLEPVKKDIESLVDQLAQKLYKAGKITDLHEDADLFKRLTLINKQFPGANILLHKAGWLPPSFRSLLAHDKLLDVVEQILGTPEIVAHPVWNLRTKTPNNEATIVPWHQDSGYMENSTYSVLQVTAWIPLLDATAQNGCLQFVKKGHRKGKVAKHECCYGNTWYIMLEEEEMEKTLGANMKTDVVTIPVPYGGAVFFNNLTPHRSLPNISDEIRWSLDLRWQSADEPVGFYGVKEGILLRTKDKNYKVDWTEWNAIDRTKRQLEVLNMEEDEFETSISGPWMKKWKLVHHNQHTDHFMRSEKAMDVDNAPTAVEVQR